MENYIGKFGKDNLKKYSGTFFRFIKLFQPTSPINSNDINNLWNDSSRMKFIILQLIGLGDYPIHNFSLYNIIDLHNKTA